MIINHYFGLDIKFRIKVKEATNEKNHQVDLFWITNKST